MSLSAVRDGKFKHINKTNCTNITVMAEWASKANYNNPLFIIYHTLQFAKHKGMYWGGGGGGGGGVTDYHGHAWPMYATSPQCENTFGMLLVHHRAELAPGMLKVVLFPVFCHPVSYCEVLPARFVTPACFGRRVLKTYRKNSFGARFVTLFQQHCNTSFLFPRCV